MSVSTVSIIPIWGDNYKPGFFGFTFYDNSFLSNGIAWFTQWERGKNVPVSHVFIVSGEDEVLEAQPKGVVRAGMRHYFEDSHCHVFFRKPKSWTPELGARIVKAGEQYLGLKYGYGLIAAHAMHGTVTGRLLNFLTFGGSGRLVSRILDSKKQAICSEYCAMALNDIQEFRARGVLKKFPPRMITPQMLPWDEELFEVWPVVDM